MAGKKLFIRYVLFFSFYVIKCLHLSLTCTCRFESFYVKYPGMISKKKKPDPIILKPICLWIFIWNDSIVGKLAREAHTSSCITKALNLCAMSPLWGLCISIWDKKWPRCPFVRKQSYSWQLATQMYILEWRRRIMCAEEYLVFPQSHILKSESISLDIYCHFPPPTPPPPSLSLFARLTQLKTEYCISEW